MKLKKEKGDSQIKATRVLVRFREIEKRKRRLTALKPLGYLLRFREILKKSPIFFARLRRKKKKETNVRFAH